MSRALQGDSSYLQLHANAQKVKSLSISWHDGEVHMDHRGNLDITAPLINHADSCSKSMGVAWVTSERVTTM